MKENNEEIKKCPISWTKRIAYMGFWFFFFKGVAWLLGIAAMYIWGPEIFENIKIFLLN